MQMLTTVQETKASASCMPMHPCCELEQIDDGFGTSLKRAKSFIEKKCSRKRKAQQEEAGDIVSFPICLQRKRVTMQKKLDKRAKVDGQ